MKRRLLLLAAVLTVFVLSNCGTGFKLPAEVHNAVSVGNGTYERIATWSGFNEVTDLLLTKPANPANEQLYVLSRTAGGVPGKVLAYPLATPSPFSFHYDGLANPVALCGTATRLFVLDQGDSCAARSNPATGLCDTTGNAQLPQGQKWTNKVAYLDKYWHVREYFPDGGDTVSTFTDTTMAWVQGIAVDNQDRVYVAGLYILVTPNPNNPFLYERRFSWRIFRYLRGGGDPNMPGCSWHRDPAYVIEEGSGLGTMVNPNGLDWTPADGGGLFIADTGNNRAQRRSDPPSPNDYLILDGENGPLNSPVDVYADLGGFSYVIGGRSRNVFRYVRDTSTGVSMGLFVQRVDIEPSSTGQELLDPVALAADLDLVYVADRGAGQIAVFRRRK